MKRARWFASIPVARSLDEIENEVRLWRSVLDQMMTDFLTEPSDKQEERDKEKAKVWLRGNTRDFYDVCYLACLDPNDVRALILEIVGTRDILYG